MYQVEPSSCVGVFVYLVVMFALAIATGFQNLLPTASTYSHRMLQFHAVSAQTSSSRFRDSIYPCLAVSAFESRDEIVPAQEETIVDELPNANGETANNKKATSSKKSKKGKTSKKRADRKTDEAPIHWRHESDDFVFREAMVSEDTSSTTSMVRFTVRGNPLPLRRHRTSRGFVYNPSAKAQASFREIVQTMLFEDNRDTSQPLFDEEHTLSMTIVFRMKRPKKHFVGGKPGPGRLRESAPSCTSVTRTDVDNLAKFILDSMNGLLYHDDRQISSLHVTKVLDNEEDCRGSTEVLLRVLKEDDLSTLLTNTFELY